MVEPIRLLIIEDSEDDAILILRELRAGGYNLEFQRVDSPETLLRACNEHWNLVISDFSMPHLSGTEALKTVRSKNVDVPFIFVSGTMGEETAVTAMRDGAQDYLMKDNLKRLVPAVQRELREYQQRQQHHRLEKHVQQLQKFEAIGRLSGGIAHDFNNMIGAILGWAELGYEESCPGSKIRDRFQKIREQSHRAAKLTSQLLAFGRKQILQPRKVNLNSLIEEEMGFLGKVIGENIKIIIDGSTDLHVTEADPVHLQQVLINLLLNARDAMPCGGKLIIATRNAEIDRDFSRQHAYAAPGNYVTLSVADTGIGMDESTIENIFEPFFTTKKMGHGTGLGLATVFGIVKQHGGFILVESELGKGSTFRAYFPASSGTHEARESESPDLTHSGSETILLAEDHEGLRETVQEMLQTLGYRVLAARDGLEAVELFKQHADEICLIVMDVVMPNRSGLEAYREISATDRHPDVIFTSGYPQDSEALNGYLERGALFLQKPYNLPKLSQIIRKALDRKALDRKSLLSNARQTEHRSQ